MNLDKKAFWYVVLEKENKKVKNTNKKNSQPKR